MKMPHPALASRDTFSSDRTARGNVFPCGWVMKSRWPHLQRALPQKQHLHCLLFLHVAVGQARAIAFPSRTVPPVRLWDLLRGLFISCHFHQHAVISWLIASAENL